jgi:pyruvate ferredoxin oxidoreductase alpha subunit
LFEDAGNDELEQLTFLDLNAGLIQYELEREARARRSGPTAEAILRRVGTVASQVG